MCLYVCVCVCTERERKRKTEKERLVRDPAFVQFKNLLKKKDVDNLVQWPNPTHHLFL